MYTYYFKSKTSLGLYSKDTSICKFIVIFNENENPKINY